MDVEQLVAQSIQIVEDDFVLDDVVRVGRLIEVATVEAIDGAGIDPFVDLQQRHADVRSVILSECPEAAVRVPILRTDAGVHDKRPRRRDREDTRLEQRLAAGDYEVTTRVAQKRFDFGRVRRRRVNHARGLTQRRESLAE